MSVAPGLERKAAAQRYEALLRATTAIAACDCESAQETITGKLREAIALEYLHFVAFDQETREPVWRLLEANGRRVDCSSQKTCSLEGTPIAWVFEQQRPLVTGDWYRETRFERHKEFLSDLGIASTCTLPVAHGRRRLGVLSVGSSRPHAFPQDEVQFLCLVADQVGLAIDAAVNYESSRLAQERLELILQLTNQVVSNLEFRELLRAISGSVRRVMRGDAAAIMLPDSDGKHLRVYALDYPETKGVFTEASLAPIEGTMPGEAFKTGKAIVINRLDPAEMPADMYSKAVEEGLHSFCDVPLVSHDRLLGVLGVARREENSFDEDEVAFLTQVAAQVAIGVENALAFGEIADLKNKLAQEKLYLEDEIRGELDFEGIVGQSSVLRHVLKLVETVAPSDSTVLLLGETGTGKERIARALHDRSRRRDQTFVKLNCAAIPTGLLESELFGHERGAFTGAISQKIGRLELADGGTLFLDEVGDIPADMQPKLLRVLQEREFERLGGTQTKKVDVRLIAATNRDLEKMVENREFRSDLYYRLNVFPIRIPPLRERPEDIPLLVRYFTQKYGRRMEKQIESIPAAAMKKLSDWHWPGNIRELENFIERSVILTQGSALQVPISELSRSAPAPDGLARETLGTRATEEREEILRILKETKGRVAGPHGAAARMGLKRTTLISRMKKLRIEARQLS
jgi:formate hydrogenlyase transcriptional activator